MTPVFHHAKFTFCFSRIVVSQSAPYDPLRRAGSAWRSFARHHYGPWSRAIRYNDAFNNTFNKDTSSYENFAKSTVAVSLCLLVPGWVYAADAAFTESSRWANGDWGGTRTDWLNKGVDLQLGYTGEMAANAQGGYDKDHTARWTEQYAVGLGVDLQKMLGWEHSLFQLTVTERDCRNLTNDRIADPRVGGYSSSQEVYGRGQTWRLRQMWLSKAWLDGALDVKAGRFDERFGLQQLSM